jgi:threonine dehydrogenase-like Zn-dependent dehydrogenase
LRERALGIAAPWRPEFFDVDEPGPDEGQLRVETVYTGLSAGTELTFLKGTNPHLHASWDAELGVFRPDVPATGYPVVRLGYMEVGRVTESRAPGFAEGGLVAMTYGHRTAHVADPLRERVLPLPDDVDPLLGVLVAHMGPICANGLLHAAAEECGRDVRDLGDGVRGRCVLVVGAGVIGLLVGLFALELGAAEVAVVDETPERLQAAAALGLHVLDGRDADVWRVVKNRWPHGRGDRGADVVFNCRARTAALALALRSLRPQGAVMDLAFHAGGSGDLRLGEELHHNGLAIRGAQIGHVPRGLGDRWDRERLSRETIGLLRARGDAIREHVVTDVVALEDAPELMLAVARRERHVIQAVFAGPAA